ncbi:MAG: hypothetical protein RI964_330 [Pseudomonadota bacterium]
MKRCLALLGLWLGSLLPVYGAPQLTIQDSVVIPAQTVQGVKLSELSGLAWDQDEQLLYALSDKGRLFHFRLQLAGNRIAAVTPVYAANLMDLAGEQIKKGRRDSEDLTILNAANGKHGDSQLVISFEGEPRIIRFTTQGLAIKNIALPPVLQNRRVYRTNNKQLESVTFHPRYGFLTAPELPLRGQPLGVHTIYAMNGQHWSFAAYPAENSGISALEALPDGNLLILERAWSGLLSPLTVSLRYLDFQQCVPNGQCRVQDLQVISSHIFIDNYEGLTHIKGNQYLMVSDDGDESLLNTTLTLFTLN